jgi:hypothetical protein
MCLIFGTEIIPSNTIKRQKYWLEIHTALVSCALSSALALRNPFTRIAHFPYTALLFGLRCHYFIKIDRAISEKVDILRFGPRAPPAYSFA